MTVKINSISDAFIWYESTCSPNYTVALLNICICTFLHVTINTKFLKS